MWTRKELKTRAKAAYKRNTLGAIIAALILAIVIGDVNLNYRYNSTRDNYDTVKEIVNSGSLVGRAENKEDIKEAAEEFSEAFNNALDEEEIEELADELADGLVESLSSIEETVKGIIVLAVAIAILIFLIIYIMIYVVKALALNVFEVGCKKFFVKDLSEKASVKEVLTGFTENYLNRVKIMFFKDLYIFLWSLLLLIPGIIKKYEYRMVPYITALNPDMPSNDVFSLSKKMMSGNKWKAFVLDLSFIGWKFLNLFTCGILGIVYVNPYQYHTNAALFETLYFEKNQFVENNNDFEIYQEA